MNRAFEQARAASIALAEHRARQKAIDDLVALAERRVAEGWNALDAHRMRQQARIAPPGPSRIAPVRIDPPAPPVPVSECADPFIAGIARRLHRG